MTLPSIHRVVTGHDENGQAVVLFNGPLPTVAEIPAIPGTVFHEVWNTGAVPVALTCDEADPTLAPVKLPPPANGTRMRFVDMPPDTAEFLARGHERMHNAFSQIGDAQASTVKKDSPHPLMHRTETIDYGIVIEGEMTLVLDDSEVKLQPGSVVIQRGTNHAWANRGDKLCRMLFILIDGRYEPSLAEALGKR
jgi:mannose-6-phosphate isomerase-like protein (cupin superfamily)